jgi:hypothetical protein
MSAEVAKHVGMSHGTYEMYVEHALFLVADPAESTGLISIAMAACLVLDDGSFNKNTPGILVALLSQSRASLRKPVSRSSTAIAIY